MTTDDPELLLFLKALVLPSILAILLVLTSKFYIGKHHPHVRKRIIQFPLWKAQMFLHPLIVFWILDRAASAAAATTTTTTTTTLVFNNNNNSYYYAILILPFAFNFGVEPFDIPTDPIFLFFFYLHHYALLMAATIITIAHGDDENEEAASLQQQQFFGRSQALLLGHAWTIHTITFAVHKKWIPDKQKIFWPYMMLGFVLKWNWWRTSSHVPVLSLLRLPVYAQFFGRWGLYVRLCIMTGWNQPSHPNHDPFEWNKQPVEASAFILSYLVVLLTK